MLSDNVDKARVLIEKIKSFHDWESGGGPKTQRTAEITEDFIKSTFENTFENILVVKLGSQQHPDFAMISGRFRKEFQNYDGKITKKLLERWEEKGGKVLWVEIKTTEHKVYILNDTFPPAEREELYIFFDIKNEKVHIATTGSIYEIILNKRGIDLKSMYEKSKRTLSQFRRKLQKCWGKSGVQTTARPTYRLPTDIAHVDDLDEETVFKRVKDLLTATKFI